MNKTWIKKGAIILGLLLVFSAVMLVLTHSAKNGRETTEYVPKISDSPIYVECVQNELLEVTPSSLRIRKKILDARLRKRENLKNS